MSVILTDYDDYPMSTDRVPVRKLVLAGRYKKRPIVRTITPTRGAVQNDEERGQGDSINARLHRILRQR